MRASLGGDGAAVHLHELRHQRQADARAAFGMGEGGADLRGEVESGDVGDIRSSRLAEIDREEAAMTEFRAYEEFINFIAAGPSSEHVTTFPPSEATRRRVLDLLAREKGEGLSPEESEELDHYIRLEHIMRLAKARARRLIAP